MTNESKPRNGDTTKQLALRLGVIGLFIVGLGAFFLYGNALYMGRATIPETVSTALSALTVIVIGAIGYAATAWSQARTARLGREEIAYQAELSRQRSDTNAAETRARVAGTEEKVSTLIARVEDGLGEKFATMVKEDAAEVAKVLRIREMEEENIALKAKLATLEMMQAAPAAPALVLPNGQAVVESIAESTAETAVNTRRDDPEGSAV